MAPPSAPVVEQMFATASPAPVFTDPDRRKKLEAAFPAIDKALEQERATQAVPGVAVGIVIDGELAYAKGFGVVDPATKSVPDADTVYRIGSISKSFIGLALLALRDDGALNLDDPLARWIPEANKLVYPTRDERPITLRQLTQHTSGLPRMGPFDPEHNPDEATVLGSLARITLDRAPGLESVYSNLGFSLLGIVVSHAGKQPLHDVVAARVFTPLKMTSTGWDAATVPAGHLAPALGPAGAMPPARLGAADGAGGIYSSVRDMARYAAFLLAAYPPRDADDHGPIRRATIREAQLTGFALEPRAKLVPNPKPGEPLVELDASAYGFGWARRQTCTATDQVGHNGAIDSYRAALVLRTSSGIGVVVLSNFGNANTEAFADRAIAALEATGAMKPREAVASTELPPMMNTFLEVYNNFDAAKLATILDRPVDPREPEELAGYKALHGTCTAIKPTRMVPSGERFALTCERGHFELDVNFGSGGKLGGFIGRSAGATPPANVSKLFDAALALHLNQTWSTATYNKVFTKKLLPEAEVRAFAANLRTQVGTCKPAGFMHEGLGWTLDLKCSKGPAIALSIQLDPHGDLEGIQFHPQAGTEPPRCPTK